MRPILDRRFVLRAIGFSLSLAVGSSSALAESPGANGALGVQTVVAETPSVGEIFIGELEKRLIQSYYSNKVYVWEHSPEGQSYKKSKHKHKHKSLPPGLAKKGKLPPGIAKQLARNHQLPPGLEYRTLPPDLIVQLPPLQVGYQYRIVDNRVLLVKAASNLILDVLTVAAVELLD